MYESKTFGNNQLNPFDTLNDCKMILLKRIPLYFLTLICSAAFIAGCATAQKLPQKNEVKSVLENANGYFMKKWPDPAKPIHVPSRTKD